MHSDFLRNINVCHRIPVNMTCCFLAMFRVFFLHRYNTCSPIILIGLIDSFTDYWPNINATESVERYRSMSATCWSRWHLLVCTSKYSYKYKTEIESLPENCFSCFYTKSINKFHQSMRKALIFFIFIFFFCILHTILYLWYSTKFFSLLPLPKNSATLQCFSLE